MEASKPDFDRIDLPTLAKDLCLENTPSADYFQFFCSHVLDSSLEANDVSRQPTCPSPSISYSPRGATATTSDFDTSSRSSSSTPRSVPHLPLQSASHAPSRYVCDKSGCSEEFALQQQLRRHAKKREDHDKMYTCNKCPASYRHPKNLRDHKQSKHQGKRYKCDIDGCEKTVAHKKNMRRHKENKHGKFTSPLVSPPETATASSTNDRSN